MLSMKIWHRYLKGAENDIRMYYFENFAHPIANQSNTWGKICYNQRPGTRDYIIKHVDTTESFSVPLKQNSKWRPRHFLCLFSCFLLVVLCVDSKNLAIESRNKYTFWDKSNIKMNRKLFWSYCDGKQKNKLVHPEFCTGRVTNAAMTLIYVVDTNFIL